MHPTIAAGAGMEQRRNVGTPSLNQRLTGKAPLDDTRSPQPHSLLGGENVLEAWRFVF